ncbi:MAG: hypothetical protein AB1465_06205 [Patescibacteria group bacterium]
MLQSEKIYKIIKIALAILIAFFALWLFNKNFDPFGHLVISYNFNREKTPLLKFKGLSESEKTFSEKKWYRVVTASPAEIKIYLPRPYKKAKIILEYQNESYPLVYLAALQKTKEFYGEKIEVLENKILDETPWNRLESQRELGSPSSRKESSLESKKSKNLVLLQKGEDKCEKELNISNFNLLSSEYDRYKLTTTKFSKKELTYEECLYKYAQDKNPDELLATGNQEKKPWMEYQFENVDDFLKNASQVIKKERVASFNYNLIPYSKIKDYNNTLTGVTPVKTFEKTIRGEHQLLTYIKDEPLDFTFYFQDLNRKKGPDHFHIFLKQGNKVLARYISRDDGNTSKNYKKSEERKLEIKTPGLPEGYYQLVLDIKSDLIVNKIETKQKYFAFENSLNLFDAKQSFEFYTNAKNISFSPLHRQGLDQEIKMTPIYQGHPEEAQATEESPKTSRESFAPIDTGAQDDTAASPQTLKIKKLQLYQTNLSGLNKISIQKNDLLINFDGLATMNLETLEKLNFSNLKSLTQASVLNNPESVDYILTTSYDPPKQISEDWKRQEVEFDLTQLGLTSLKPKLNLLLQIPGFDRDRGDIKLRKIKIVLEKDPWSFNYLKNVIKTRLKENEY